VSVSCPESEIHPPVAADKTGLLLVNLGTPDAPDKEAVKRYLKEFLSDRRVVDIPAFLWQPILRGIILNTRPAKSAQAYRSIWTDEGSPLAVYTGRQAEAVAERLGEGFHVDWAMRYGNPSIAERLKALKQAGCERILIMPLYPQYSGATNASADDAVTMALKEMRWQPTIRTLAPYCGDAAYIDALAKNLNRQLAALEFEPDALVISFHGLPQRAVERGDPYFDHCQKTASLLAEALGKELTIAFQSRFGRAKWLEPATDKVLEGLPMKGAKNIAIFAPGFASDCLETLEELAIRGRQQFMAAGGEQYAYLPCLNDSDIGIDMLETLVRQELAEWI